MQTLDFTMMYIDSNLQSQAKLANSNSNSIACTEAQVKSHELRDIDKCICYFCIC